MVIRKLSAIAGFSAKLKFAIAGFYCSLNCKNITMKTKSFAREFYMHSLCTVFFCTSSWRVFLLCRITFSKVYILFQKKIAQNLNPTMFASIFWGRHTIRPYHFFKRPQKYVFFFAFSHLRIRRLCRIICTRLSKFLHPGPWRSRQWNLAVFTVEGGLD